MALAVLCHSISMPRSVHPGCGYSVSALQLATAISLPWRSKRAAFETVLPLSMPKRYWAMTCLPGHARRAKTKLTGEGGFHQAFDARPQTEQVSGQGQLLALLVAEPPPG